MARTLVVPASSAMMQPSGASLAPIASSFAELMTLSMIVAMRASRPLLRTSVGSGRRRRGRLSADGGTPREAAALMAMRADGVAAGQPTGAG